MAHSRIASTGRTLTVAFFAGSAALLLGERVLGDSETPRFVASGAGALCLLLSSLGRALIAARGPAPHRRSARTLAFAHLGGLLAAALYALSTHGGLALLGQEVPLSESTQQLRVVLQCLFPILWLASALPLLLIQRSAPPLAVDRPPEDRRVLEAGLAGWSLAFAAAFLFSVNVLASRHDASVDLSHFRTAHPGQAVRELVARMAEPVEVILFFPEGNEVAAELDGYFQALARSNAGLALRRVDRFLAPALARQHEIDRDGVVLLRKGEKSEQWSLATDLSAARYALRQLDREFYERLIRIAQSGQIAYLTTGHGELADRRASDGVAGTRIRSFLRRLGYEAKTLGLREGLGSEIPSDASVVLLLGPVDPLLREEGESLRRYLKDGGRLLLALDPGQSANVGDLLAELGLVYHEAVLVNEQYHLRRRFNRSDRQVLYTGSFSSHPSIANLGRDPWGRFALVLNGSGSLERAADTRGADIDFTVRSMTGTWADLDGDFEFAVSSEEKKMYRLAAAVERKLTADGNEREAEVERSGGSAEPTLRAIVLADVDLLSDTLMESAGNQLLLGDGLQWLAGEPGASTQVDSPRDVAVEHTRQQDITWFYATVFGAPLLVLGLGRGYVRLRRRRSR